MQIEHEEQYDRFMDTIKLSLILWRRAGRQDITALSEKLGISERTVHRRCSAPETLTLGELFAWCEYYGKDPVELLRSAFSEAYRPELPSKQPDE